MYSSIVKSISRNLKVCTIIFFCFSPNAQTRVLDDFNDNNVKGWNKFDLAGGKVNLTYQ